MVFALESNLGADAMFHQSEVSFVLNRRSKADRSMALANVPALRFQNLLSRRVGMASVGGPFQSGHGRD